MSFSPLQSVAECMYAIGNWLKKSLRNKLLFTLSVLLLLAASYAPPLHRHFTMGCMIAIALVLWALFSLFFGFFHSYTPFHFFFLEYNIFF